MAERIKLQRSILTETSAGYVVEIVYAETHEIEEAWPSIVIRLPVQEEEHPNLPDARLEALERVRSLVNDEIEAIELRKRGRSR